MPKCDFNKVALLSVKVPFLSLYWSLTQSILEKELQILRRDECFLFSTINQQNAKQNQFSTNYTNVK